MVAIIGYSLCHKSKGGLAGLNISTYTMEGRIFFKVLPLDALTVIKLH